MDEKYDRWSEQGLLRKSNILLDPNEKHAFDTHVANTPRIQSSFEISTPITRSLEKGWFYTQIEDACVPATILTGMLIMSEDIDPDLPKTLYQFAHTKNTTDNLFGGMNYKQAQTILETFKDVHVHIAPWKQMTLVSESYKSVHVTQKSDDITKFVLDEEYEKYIQELHQTLSEGNVVLATVDSGPYGYTVDQFDRSAHALAIVGMRKKENYVDVQIVDSNRGVSWIPLEHILRSTSALSTQYILEHTQKAEDS